MELRSPPGVVDIQERLDVEGGSRVVYLWQSPRYEQRGYAVQGSGPRVATCRDATRPATTAAEGE